jgi:hypothetical protein
MTVLCAEARAAVLGENLIRKIIASEGVDTTNSREQFMADNDDHGFGESRMTSSVRRS